MRKRGDGGGGMQREIITREAGRGRRGYISPGKVAISPKDKITQKTKSPTPMKKDKITHLKITQGQKHPKDQSTQKTKAPKRPKHQKDKISHFHAWRQYHLT